MTQTSTELQTTSGMHGRAVITPEFTTISVFSAISGMSKSEIYRRLGSGELVAHKLGRSTLIDVKHGLDWIRSRPVAVIRPARY